MRTHLGLVLAVVLTSACDLGSNSSTPTEPAITTVSARPAAVPTPTTPPVVPPVPTIPPAATGAAVKPVTTAVAKTDGGATQPAALPTFAVPSGLPTAITIPSTITIPTSITIPSSLPAYPTAAPK